MGYQIFAETASELHQAATCLRRADRLQQDCGTHRINPMESLAREIDDIAKLLSAGAVSAATKKSYSLLVAVDKAATLNINVLARSELAKALGGIRTEAKTRAAKNNGLKGGRPRKDGKPPVRRSV